MKISALAVLTILSSCVPIPPALEQSAWRLELPGVGGGSAVPVRISERIDGPGFLVYYLTAKHVTQHGPAGWQVILGDRILTNGFVVAEHPVLDLAVLAFPIPPSPHPHPLLVPLSDRLPSVGHRLRVVGYARPADRALWANDGMCSGPGRLSTQTWPGDSGGAVLDARGRLVGIILGGYAEPGPFGERMIVPGKTRFAPVSAAWEWLQKQLPG